MKKLFLIALALTFTASAGDVASPIASGIHANLMSDETTALIALGAATRSLFYLFGTVVAIAIAAYSLYNGYTCRYIRMQDSITKKWHIRGLAFRYKITRNHHAVREITNAENDNQDGIHVVSQYLTVYGFFRDANYGFFRDAKRHYSQERLRIGKREYLIRDEHARSSSTRLWHLDQNIITEPLREIGVKELKQVSIAIQQSMSTEEFLRLFYNAQRDTAGKKRDNDRKARSSSYRPQYFPRSILLINLEKDEDQKASRGQEIRRSAIDNLFLWFRENEADLKNALDAVAKKHESSESQSEKTS